MLNEVSEQHAGDRASIVAAHEKQLEEVRAAHADDFAKLQVEQRRLSDEHLLQLHNKQQEFDNEIAQLTREHSQREKQLQADAEARLLKQSQESVDQLAEQAKQLAALQQEELKALQANWERSKADALAAQAADKFSDDIIPINIDEVYVDKNGKRAERQNVVGADEGPRKGTTKEALAKLKPVFMNGGTVTAGNASQMSDGAAFCLIMSEEMVKSLNLEPIARLVSYKVVGVEPRIMGIGPVDAIPAAIEMAGLKMNDINLYELNEAFASQSLAVIRETGINPDIVNVNGGAIALGHPLGCTGAKLTVQIIEEMKLRQQKYGMVTMCVGTGQGAAGVIEML